MLDSMPASNLRGSTYDEKMPTIAEVNKMSINKVYKKIAKIRTSIFFGYTTQAISSQLSKRLAYKYLIKMIL